MPLADEIVATAMTYVQQDIVDGFDKILDPGLNPMFEFDDLGGALAIEQSITRSDEAISMPWRYTATHVGPFLGIPATNITFTLRGMTIVIPADKLEDWQFFRCIDYLCALHELGVTTTTRPALTPDEYGQWLDLPSGDEEES
jgi:hypothetical protein